MSKATPEPPSLDTLHAVVRSVCESRPLARVEVFGSVARGAARAGSDVDLLVEFLPEAIPGLLEMGALREGLEERLGCRVDLLSRKAVEKSRNAIRRRGILESGDDLCPMGSRPGYCRTCWNLPGRSKATSRA